MVSDSGVFKGGGAQVSVPPSRSVKNFALHVITSLIYL